MCDNILNSDDLILEQKSMADLAGILASYTDGYISDEEMEQAITEVILERAMLK